MDKDEKLSSTIFNVNRLIKEKIRLSDCLNGFPYTEIEVLRFVESKKKTTMKSIADYLHIKPPSATPLIDSLVKRGSLKRAQKIDDRRVVYVELTPKGLKSLQKKHDNIHKIVKIFFSKLNNKDKQNLITILEKISYGKNN